MKAKAAMNDKDLNSAKWGGEKFVSFSCPFLASRKESGKFEATATDEGVSVFELLDSKKEQLFSTSPVDPAVSRIQKSSCHTEGHVTVALQRY